MESKILSVGIDIGTSTTQIIFSEIILENTAGSFFVPKVEITKKNIIYRSEIYFTPIIKRKIIDLEKLKEIIMLEYKRANIDKNHISTGAIIITGESTRKENAEKVLNALSDFAGDFVVATAGADLEAILSGYGSGAYSISKNDHKKIINFDIGGGTTNVVIFSDGKILDSFALNIGGRIIRFDEKGKIIYISEKVEKLIKSLELNIKIGMKPEFKELKTFTDNLAKIIYKISNNTDLSKYEDELFIDHEDKNIKADFCMFSGGVSEFIYSDDKIKTLIGTLEFGDIGPLLGYCIRKVFDTQVHRILEPKEKIRATVIGAGSYSLRLSGSTIIFDDDILPMKNIPIIKLFDNEDENMDDILEKITKKINMYKDSNVAIAFKGSKSPNYAEIKKIADSIVRALKHMDNPIIVVIENDFAKALGQTIKIMIKENKKVICIDNIIVDDGDYIDIGKSISNIVPVVIKTLIFKS